MGTWLGERKSSRSLSLRGVPGILLGEIMAKVKGNRNDNRPNGKAEKKRPKIFDAIKRRLVNK